MGLYDSYRLANSTAIPQFEGSAGDDFVKVGQYKQGLYDTNIQSVNDTGEQAGEVSSIFHQDQGAVNELRTGVQQKIEGLVKRGDFENMGLEARQLGQDFTNRSKEIMAPQQQAMEYKKSLENKDLNLTPEQKQGLFDMSMTNYQGVQKNARGQYVGTFNGRQAAKNIDVPDWVDKRMKDIAVHKNGDTYESAPDGGMWIIKNGVKTEKVSAQEITGTLKSAMASDTDYQSFKNMQADIAGHYARKVADPNMPGMFAYAARQHTAASGRDFKDVYSNMINRSTHQSIDEEAMRYALNKYQKSDVETEHGLKTNEYTLKDHDKSTAGPFMMQGPDNKLTNDEKNYDKLTATTNDNKAALLDINSHISALQQRLTNPNLSPTTRTQLSAELSNSQDRKDAVQGQANRAEDIQNYSKMVTAQKMGYTDYDDFMNKAKPAYKSEIAKVFPSGIPTKGGKIISPDELAEAAVDGRLKTTMSTMISGDNSPAAPTGMLLTMKDGTKVPINGNSRGFQLMDAIAHASGQANNKVDEFQDKLSKEHEDNVKDFAVQSTNISIPSEEAKKNIKDLLVSNKDGVRFSNPGQLDKVDAPDNFRVVSIGTAGTGTDTKLQVEELDKDNKPTGKTYDATTTNSNIAEQLGRTFARSQAPEDKLAADILSHNSGARQLSAMIPGQSLDLKRQVKGEDGNTVNASISIIRHSDKTVSYNLVDKDTGDILKSTKSSGEAGRWVDDVNGTDTYSNGRRKVIK